jgi:hypothetical protein
MASDWVKIVTVASGFEADLTRAMLEEQNIPVLIRGKQAGLFGGGFQGAVPGGVDILVPSSVALRARELIDADEESDVGGESDADT